MGKWHRNPNRKSIKQMIISSLRNTYIHDYLVKNFRFVSFRSPFSSYGGFYTRAGSSGNQF
jgi:hypothetical protein